MLFILYALLFILLAIKGYVNYRFDLEEEQMEREGKSECVLRYASLRFPEEVMQRVEIPSKLSNRLQTIREVDLRSEYRKWKENIEEVTQIRQKIGLI